MLKENGSKYSLLEKTYNALFYSVLEYIHQLSVLSHVKYRNSNFTRIEKNQNIIKGPSVINKIALSITFQKKYIMPISTIFWSISTISLCSLMLNTEILIYANRKTSK